MGQPIDPGFERERAMGRDDLLIDFQAERERLAASLETPIKPWVESSYSQLEEMTSLVDYRAEVNRRYHAS